MSRQNGQRVVAVAMLLAIFIGMWNYFSWNGFIRPVAWQVVRGYSKNTVPDGATPYDRVVLVRNNVEKYANEIFLKEQYINLHTLTQMALDKRVIEDAGETVARLDNGYLTWVRPVPSDSTMVTYAENIKGLQSYLRRRGIDFLYIQAPFKTSKYDPQLPPGIVDDVNPKADLLLSQLHGTVDYIDLRAELHESGLNQYDYFFKTDHHWKSEGAFWAWGVIAGRLNADYGFQIEPSFVDANLFHSEVYEQWFLGSQGKRVGPLYAGVDDISIITPLFDTTFTFEIPTKNLTRTGSFSEVMFEYSSLHPKDYFKQSPYAVYTGGDFPLNIIKNLKNPDGKRVLLLKDSFGCTLAPFLAFGCKELDMVDLRYFSQYSKDGLLDYIEKTDPDIVMIIYNPSGFTDVQMSFS